MLWAAGVLIQEMSGWPIMFSIIFTVAIVGLYTIMGGLSAVVMTDVVQVIIMVVGCMAILILGLWELGGWTAMTAKIYSLGSQYKHHFDLVKLSGADNPYPWPGILFGLSCVLAPAYYIGNQSIIQRSLGAVNEWHAKASMLFGAFIKILIPFLVVMPGLVALALYPGAANPDQVFGKLIKDLLPPGLTGLVFVAFLAALMSTVSAVVNSAATVWIKDIYELLIRKNSSDKHYLFAGRITAGVVVVFAIIIAPLSSLFPGVYIYGQTINSFIQGPIFAVLLLGMFWKRANRSGALFGIIGGVALSCLMFLFRSSIFTIKEPFLYIAWWSFVGSLIITVIASLFSKPEPESKLDGLVYGTVVN
jgi:SSS family solute:Na+ symporter